MFRRWILAATGLLIINTGAVGQTIRSTGPGAWGSATRLVEELRIGTLEGDQAYTFGQIEAIVVGKGGEIIVAEFEPARLRMYGANGRLIREIGGIGSGPGEYRDISGLKVLQDGSIAIWDGQTGRITKYDSNGQYRTSHAFKTGFFTADMFQVDRAGNFYVKAAGKNRQRSGTFAMDEPIIWIKLNPAGAVVDTIPVPQGESPSLEMYGGPGNSRVDPLLAALSPFGYFVTGAPLRYAIDVQRPGKPLRIERTHTPVRLAGAERAEWNAMADHLSKQPIGMSMRRNQNGGTDTIFGPTVKYAAPETKPVFRSLQVDDDGRIWVERHVAARRVPPGSSARAPISKDPRPPITWREPATYDVFEPDGRFLGTVTAPDKTTFHARRGRHIWAVQRGEFDEPYIVRYRIESTGR